MSEYDEYIKDQREDSIRGESMKETIYRYCALITNNFGVKLNTMNILDVGPREFFTYDYFLEKHNNEITGIDICEKALETYKNKNLIDCDAHFMNDRFDQKFDLVISLHSFEHMYDLDKVLKNCYDILNTNGKLFFAVPIPSRNERRGHWVDIPNEDDMIKRCLNAGFKEKFIETSFGKFRNENEMLGIFQK